MSQAPVHIVQEKGDNVFAEPAAEARAVRGDNAAFPKDHSHLIKSASRSLAVTPEFRTLTDRVKDGVTHVVVHPALETKVIGKLTDVRLSQSRQSVSIS